VAERCKHPLCGDGRYGSRLKGSVALFSASLAFTHPVSGEAMAFEALPPREGFWQLFSLN
jgi:23S rRNA pseudouridine1911/1915/1917 synthase